MGVHDGPKYAQNTIKSHLVGIEGSKNVIEGNVIMGASVIGGACDTDVFPAIDCTNCTVIGNVVRDTCGVGLLDTSGSTGYSNNQFENNNGGNENPQVSGGIEMGINICGGDTTCP